MIQQQKSWRTTLYENGVIEIRPERDKNPHNLGELCKCKPEVYYEQNSLVIKHNSWDGRELNEHKGH